MINHSERLHAKLSASSSSRWLNCPGSVKLEEKYPDFTSDFAEEGTLAHELADICLKNEENADKYINKKITDKIITEEMANYVQVYIDYIRAFESYSSMLLTEERVDFSNTVPSGFGTVDCAIINEENHTLHIFDLKYGKGVLVDAENNTQAQLYALGLINELKFLYNIKDIIIHIIQPRISNFSKWGISIKQLNEFAKYASKQADLALSDNAPFNPGEKQCRWCKAKADCKVLFNFTNDIVKNQFDDIDSTKTTDEQKRSILDNKKLIELYIKSIEEYVYNKLQKGEKFKGYKFVQGRSNRKWAEDAEEFLLKKLGEDAYNKKLISITEAEKKISKDEIKSLTLKPRGKLTVVQSSDKRKEIKVDKIENEFEQLT